MKIKSKNERKAITITQLEKQKAMGFLGLGQVGVNLQTYDEETTFVNDFNRAMMMKIREYGLWYQGDSDLLLSWYTRANTIDYNYEPYFARNKQNYFWCVSSTEGNIKRTHSGQPRNIVDTLVNIIGMPSLAVQTDERTGTLRKILKANHFTHMLKQQQLPLTLVEGWGAFKINWNLKLSQYPIILYYRAENVSFIRKSGVLIAIMFKDYYFDDKKNKYLLLETRSKGTSKETLDDGTVIDSPCLYISKELYRVGSDGENLIPADFKEIKQLEDINPLIKVSNYRGFLAVPSIFFEDTENGFPGRSIFTNKIDLFDDLDQCLSQSSNTVRRSTTKEYFDTDYLERDRNTGLPIAPKAFDRSYTLIQSPKDANGVTNNEPVTVTQPRLDFMQYDGEAKHILVEIMSGILSPATIGIDISKNDNAAAQREKEKVTIFTRNTIIEEESLILEQLCSELLCAEELIRTGRITLRDYEVSVAFDEYADMSFEDKSNVLLQMFAAGAMSPQLFVEKLWKNQLNKEDFQREVTFMTEGAAGPSAQEAKEAEMMQDPSQMSPEQLGQFGAMGASGAGNNAAGMVGNTQGAPSPEEMALLAAALGGK